MRHGLFGLLLCLLVSLTAKAQERQDVVGTIKTSMGSAFVERQGQRLEATVGAALFRSDRLVTGNPGSVGVTLIDDTLLTAGADTQLELSELRFNSTTQEGSMLIRLLRGVMHIATGLIARRSPESVRIETPTAVMGVRGTSFIVEARGRP
jgi:hypothetical protein